MTAWLLGWLLPVLAGAAGALAVLLGAYGRGRRDAARETLAARDRAALDTRHAIDEAVHDAPTDSAAARRALAERLRRGAPRE